MLEEIERTEKERVKKKGEFCVTLMLCIRSQGVKVVWNNGFLLILANESLSIWTTHGGSVRVFCVDCSEIREEDETEKEEGP